MFSSKRLAPLFLALALLALGRTPAFCQVPGVIFDSDMSSDHDDIADLSVVEALADLGECNLLACMSSSQNGATALCMSAINTYYGRPNIPCGRRPDQGGVGGYPAQIASEFPHPLYAAYTDCPLAVDVYRQVLASQPDHSVIIVTAGFLNNIQALLQSGPDQYSPLSGSALVVQKVKLLSCAGGNYPSGDEFNFKVEPAASCYAIDNWPSSAFFDGYDIGQVIYTGGELQSTPTTNPIRRGFELTFFGPYPSWTQIMIYYAIRNAEAQTLWKYNTYGHNYVDSTGHNTWLTDSDPTGAQEQGYLLEVQRYPIQQALDTLVMDSGAPKSLGTQYPPNQPTNLRATVSGNTINLQWSDNSWNETGFTIERKVNGVFTQIATVGANVTSYADTGLASTANVAYRVSAFNAQGRSGTSPVNAVFGSGAFPLGPAGYATVTVYGDGWTESNLSNPSDHTPIYNYYQYDNLNWARGANICSHVVVNNDSMTGQDVAINVMVGGMGAYGRYFVYFLYQDQNNWYRVNTGSSGQGQSNYTTVFEKCVNGTITTLATNANEGVNIGNGSLLQTWQLVVSHTGTMQFSTNNNPSGNAYDSLHPVLSATDTFAFPGGKIALGSDIGQPVWDNFSFDTGAGGVSVPAAPTALSATPGNAQVTLNWTASSGATGYNVSRGTASGGEGPTAIATNVNAPSYTDTGLTNGTAYYYTVAAVNGSGTSGASNEASATPNAGGSVPAAPASLTASAGNSQVSLSWTASSGATSYNVYRGSATGGESATAIASGLTTTTYTNTGLTGGTTYYYEVAAVNAAGVSGYSNEASATPSSGGGNSSSAAFANGNFETPAIGGFSYTPAGSGWTFTNYAGIQHNGSAYSGSTTVAPDGTQTAFLQGVSNTLGTMSQSVSFAAAGTYTIGFQAARRYGAAQPIQVSINGVAVGTYTPSSNNFEQITTASFSIGSAGNYTVLLAATDSSSDKTTFIDSLSIANAGASAPAAPTGLGATGSSAQVSLAWTASPGATSYNVYRGTGSGGETSTPIASGLTTPAYSDTGLSNGTKYYYEVSAVGTAGTSAFSNEAAATPLTAYEQWKVNHGLAYNSDDTATPDGDGIAVLIKFATGMTLGVPGVSPVSLVAASGGRELRFQRLSPPTVSYAVEASSDLVTWSAIATLPAGATAWSGTATVTETGSGTPVTTTVLDVTPVALGVSRFLRLRVTASP